MLRSLRTETLLNSKLDSATAFCFVHWNAPDFLLLSVKQVEKLHPESKIYVLDNGSQTANLVQIRKQLEQFHTITLISAKLEYPYARIRLFRQPIGRLAVWFGHTMALQFLLNYSACQSDKYAIFLDQDCILSRNILPLMRELDRGALLVGVRDYLSIPKDYGQLKRRLARQAYNLVHASFMMLQPQKIHDMFGNISLYGERRVREPFQGISYRAAGKILYLDMKMHDEIPFLTSYHYRGETYAWHAWYSSRTFGRPSQGSLDGLPVSWYREVRKMAYEYMRMIYEKIS
jgi:hypothetical protein